MMKIGGAPVAAMILLSAMAANRPPASAQTTACTTAMLTSFMPCMGFLTGSGLGAGSSPVTSCCKAVRDLMSGSSACACFLFSGAMQFGSGVPFNQSLAYQLPSICGSSSVPLLRCKPSNFSGSGFPQFPFGLLSSPPPPPPQVVDAPSPTKDGPMLKPFELPSGAVPLYFNQALWFLPLLFLLLINP